MKTMRAISLILMFTLSIGPALASACTVACALPMAPASQAAQVNGMTMESEMHSAASHTEMQSHAGMQSTETQSTETMGTDMGMHCHDTVTAAMPEHDAHNKPDQGQHPSQTNCTMTDCHFAQVPPIASPDNEFRIDASAVTLPRSNVFGASADLSPPIKPPA